MPGSGSMQRCERIRRQLAVVEERVEARTQQKWKKAARVDESAVEHEGQEPKGGCSSRN